MGIHSLTKLIQSKSPDSIQTTSLYKLNGKKVAIDTSIFLYKSLSNIRKNGEYVTNTEGKVISHIIGIINKAIQYIELGITPIFIFDGKPPIEKQFVLIERNKKAKEAKLLSEKSTTPEDKQKYEKSSIRIKKHHIDDIKQLLELMGISYIHAVGEAEVYASELCRTGYVDYVLTEDMDTLPSGCPKMIRSCLDRSIKRTDVVSIIDLNKILEDFEMDMSNFVDMCILCGCDYCPTIPKIGINRAFGYIKKYKTIEMLLESNKVSNVPQEFIDNYDKSRKLFEINKDKLTGIPIHNFNYDENKLTKYLKNTCNFHDKKISKITAKLNLK